MGSMKWKEKRFNVLGVFFVIVMSSQQVRKYLSNKRCNSQQLGHAAIPGARCGIWMVL